MNATKQTLLGVNLKSLREIHQLSINKLATQSGVSKSIISRLESGEQRTASQENLQALAKVFNLQVGVLRELSLRPSSPLSEETQEALGREFHISGHHGVSASTERSFLTEVIARLQGLEPEDKQTQMETLPFIVRDLIVELSLSAQDEEDRRKYNQAAVTIESALHRTGAQSIYAMK